jgi:phage tail-like protein
MAAGSLRALLIPTSPASWLGWLASWLNLTVNPHWPEDRQRRLLDEVMELYRWRGRRTA